MLTTLIWQRKDLTGLGKKPRGNGLKAAGNFKYEIMLCCNQTELVNLMIRLGCGFTGTVLCENPVAKLISTKKGEQLIF